MVGYELKTSTVNVRVTYDSDINQRIHQKTHQIFKANSRQNEN